jgi:hypothetical protein
MITTPASWIASTRKPNTSNPKPRRKPPSAVAEAPSRTNTVENPAMKPALPRRIRPRRRARSSTSCSSSTDTPDTSER